MNRLTAMLLIGALVAGCAPAAPAEEAPLPAEIASPEPSATPAAVPSPTRAAATRAPAPTATASPPFADQALTPILPATSAPVLGEVPDSILGPILDDAAARSGLPRSELVITRAEAVTWSDGSLGCPEPDQAYIQVLIDGYWVVVSAGDALYDYRVDNRGYFKLCGGGLSGSVEVPPGGVIPVETVEPEDR